MEWSSLCFPLPSLPYRAPQSLIYFLSTWLCLFCVVHVMESCTAWSLSDSPHSELHVSQVHLCLAVYQAHVPTLAERHYPVWMSTGHSFISCHPSGLFPLSGFVNNTATNIHVQVSTPTSALVSTGHLPGGGIAGSSGYSVWSIVATALSTAPPAALGVPGPLILTGTCYLSSICWMTAVL